MKYIKDYINEAEEKVPKINPKHFADAIWYKDMAGADTAHYDIRYSIDPNLPKDKALIKYYDKNIQYMFGDDQPHVALYNIKRIFTRLSKLSTYLYMFNHRDGGKDFNVLFTSDIKFSTKITDWFNYCFEPDGYPLPEVTRYTGDKIFDLIPTFFLKNPTTNNDSINTMENLTKFKLMFAEKSKPAMIKKIFKMSNRELYSQYKAEEMDIL